MKKFLFILSFVLVAATAFAGQKTSTGDFSVTSSDPKLAKLALAPIDINSADATELQKIPGVGSAYATKIIANRPYTRKDQLLSKKVLPEAVYNKISVAIIAKSK